jgi:hypothetical protein
LVGLFEFALDDELPVTVRRYEAIKIFNNQKKKQMRLKNQGYVYLSLKVYAIGMKSNQ